jgi:hypothetical protein
MKYCFFAIIIFFSFSEIKGQVDSEKNAINYGFGYYGDIMQFVDPGYGDTPSYIKDNPRVYGKILHGYAIKCGYERVLNTGFVFSTNLYIARVNSFFNDPLELFWDNKKFDHYIVTELSFSKDLLANKRHSMTPSLGFLYRHLILEEIEYLFELQGEELVLVSYPEIMKRVMSDIGLSFGLDYRYVFQNRFFTGLSFRSNLIFNIGFETIYISPIIGVKF